MLLDDGPPPAPAAPAAPSGASPLDPLSAAASSREGPPPPKYQDIVAPQQQPVVAAPAAPPAAPAAASGGPLGHSGSSGAAPQHRQQASLTLDSLEINADDAGFLHGGGAGPSTRPPSTQHITVTDPVRRVGDSLIPGLSSTHFEFLVTSASEAPRRRVEVRRRFKDFVVSAEAGGRVGGGVG